MLAFSGNALLTRAALASYNMDPELVLLLRVSAGAITLLLICYLRKYSLQILSNLHLKTAAALSLYLVGFSYAFTGLETGIGVLIQFGVVQLVMFASSFLSDKQVPKNKSIGAIIAFTGLIYLLWPSGDFTLDMKSSVLMAIAGMAWGIYSILGKNNLNFFLLITFYFHTPGISQKIANLITHYSGYFFGRYDFNFFTACEICSNQ